MNNRTNAARAQEPDPDENIDAPANNNADAGPLRRLRWLCAIACSDLPGSCLTVATVIADKYVNHSTGYAYPSIGRIMADTKLCRNTVKNVFDRLEKAGCLKREGSRKGGGSNNTNRYRPVLDWVSEGAKKVTRSENGPGQNLTGRGPKTDTEGAKNVTRGGQPDGHEQGDEQDEYNKMKEQGEGTRGRATTPQLVIDDDWWPTDASVDKAKEMMGDRYLSDCLAVTIRFLFRHLVSGSTSTDWDAAWLDWVAADMKRLNSGEPIRFDELPARKLNARWMPSTAALLRITTKYAPFSKDDMHAVLEHIAKFRSHYLSGKRPSDPEAKWIDWFETDLADPKNKLTFSAIPKKARLSRYAC